MLFLFLLIGMVRPSARLAIKGIIRAAAVLFSPSSWPQAQSGIELQAPQLARWPDPSSRSRSASTLALPSSITSRQLSAHPRWWLTESPPLGLYVGKAMEWTFIAGTSQARHNTPALFKRGRRGQRRPRDGDLWLLDRVLFGVSWHTKRLLWQHCTTAPPTRMPSPPVEPHNPRRARRSSFVGDIYEKLHGEKVPLDCAEAKWADHPSDVRHPRIPADSVTVVGPRGLVARAATELGHASALSCRIASLT